MLPNTLKEGYDNTDGDTLVAIKTTALLVRLAYKLPETKAKALRRTVGDSKSRTTNCDTGCNCRRGTNQDRLRFIAASKDRDSNGISGWRRFNQTSKIKDCKVVMVQTH